ncbi:MAG: VirB3 family type IV secretion system protein [Rickettsiales bacterium]|jgi:type IV secretory pathway VirB3-like protein|nr:VirB3 family type IV secretion system protein [Rickettsiales bacterium]
MRQQVLKALANPARIFYVPYSVAVLNFAIQFIIFIIIFFTGLILSGGSVAFNPLYFIISVCAVHMMLAGFSKSEPQLANIIAAKIRLFRLKLPKYLDV